ncbi:MAG: CopD family protein [Rhodocyclales bacterium]|nr:CopD family protein [Rhodocyclales bacterium]
MIDFFGVAARWLELAANMVLVGSPLFLFLARYDRTVFRNPWLTRLEGALPWLAVLLPVALVASLAASTAQITGDPGTFWQPGAWLDLIRNLQLGKVWLIRELMAVVLLGLTLYVVRAPSAQWRYLAHALCAGLTLAISSFAGHPAAEGSLLTMATFGVHVVFASVWFGGLPAFLAILYGAGREPEIGSEDRAGIAALHRFSAMALPAMTFVVATGVLLGDSQIAPIYAALVATRYGWLLTGKVLLLVIILVIAARVRFTWLPSFETRGYRTEVGIKSMRRLVLIEFGLATLLVLLAAALASTLPGKHAGIENWPYPFRFSFAATWDFQMWTQTQLIASGIFLMLALAYPVWGKFLPWSLSKTRGIAIALVCSATGLALYAVSIVANPYTYRPTTVAFDAISIDRGTTLFAENCVACHGLQGKGDGPLVGSLPKKPIDLLTEPHTKQHTVGDFYYWISTGFPEFGMPPFGDRLSEDDRWDLVNYIHAMSRGYESRPLRPQVVPEKPSQNLGAPDFSLVTQTGASATLKDYRGTKTVLLVLFSWPESKTRLEQLAQEYPALQGTNTEVIAVPLGAGFPDKHWLDSLPYPLVVQGASEIARTYVGFRRTIADPDLFGAGKVPTHLELMVDRFGYLRARWLPQQDGPGWSDKDFLFAQLRQLQKEKEILPPAEDHVH